MATYGSFKKIAGDEIIDGSVTASDISALAIDSNKLATNSVGSNQLVNNSVESTKFNTGAVTTNKLASTVDLSSKTVTYRPISDNDFSGSSNIATSKLSGAVSDISSNGLAQSAFTDTTNASNISSGTLAPARGGRGTEDIGFDVWPNARGNSRGTITWTAANLGGVRGASSNTFAWDNQTVTVYQSGIYISTAEVITAGGTGENDMFYYVNGTQITDFRGGSNVSNHSAVSGAILLNLSSGDTVNIQCNNWHENQYSRWSFYKLGGWA